jgi:hypothetical protein
MRASTIMLGIVVVLALWVGVTVGLAVKRSMENVGHRLDCALAQAEGKSVDGKGRQCLPVKTAAN